MTTPKLLIDVSVRQVVTLTLNRPDSANACDAEMLAMLAAALRRVAAEPSARIIVLRGAGRHFCGGADVRASRQDAVRSDDVVFADVCRLLDGLLKPTIAVVHGGCVGGGVGFAACCDVVIAADDAFFAVPEVRLGIAPGALALYFMRAMGSRSLRRYLLTGERFSAQIAKQHGLVHIVQPASDLDAALADIVDSLLLGAPGALGRAKTTLARYDSARVDDEAFEAMEAAFRDHVAGAEADEGRASFREKRKPNWYPTTKDDGSSR